MQLGGSLLRHLTLEGVRLVFGLGDEPPSHTQENVIPCVSNVLITRTWEDARRHRQEIMCDSVLYSPDRSTPHTVEYDPFLLGPAMKA